MTSKVILIAEDDPSIQELYIDAFYGEVPAKLIITSDGQQAVDYYRDNYKSINLVILDVMMPNLRGDQAFFKMKKINPEIKAVIVTGYDNGHVTDITKYGVLKVIYKPFGIHKLTKLIKLYLGEENGTIGIHEGEEKA